MPAHQVTKSEIGTKLSKKGNGVPQPEVTNSNIVTNAVRSSSDIFDHQVTKSHLVTNIVGPPWQVPRTSCNVPRFLVTTSGFETTKPRTSPAKGRGITAGALSQITPNASPIAPPTISAVALAKKDSFHSPRPPFLANARKNRFDG